LLGSKLYGNGFPPGNVAHGLSRLDPGGRFTVRRNGETDDVLRCTEWLM
jgi:hypothetical protein